jgi:hypothetical protein
MNCNNLKYGTCETFDIFLFISFDVDQNIGEPKTRLRTRSFPSSVVHLKGCSPYF